MKQKNYNPKKQYWHSTLLKGILLVLFCCSTQQLFAQPTTQIAKILAGDPDSNDQFSRSVSISGDYAIVGAHLEDAGGTSAGAAYIYKRSGSSWTQEAKLLASDPQAGDIFGYSVSISGDYAIVGAYFEDAGGTNAGAAYIFKRSGTNWAEETKLLASDPQADDFFGRSVSISGDYAIVGAYFEDAGGTNAGAAYIFKRSGTNWAEETKLIASDAQAGDSFGWSVSISGDYAIVGAYQEDAGDTDAGAAYIYKRSGSSWTQEAKLLASDPQADDFFGVSVSISGDYAIVGAYREDAGTSNLINAGAAYIFKRSGTSWAEETKLLASDVQAFDWFGWSVSISGDYAIVGAYREDTGGIDAGAAYIYKRSGSSWTQEAKLRASDPQAGDIFGYSVSISGDYAIVGAYREDAGTSNVSDAGAAYMFGADLEINVQGGSPLVSIVDGDVTPDAADNTDFGTVAKGATQTVTYSIQNAGTDDLIVSSIELAGAAPSNFVVSGITFPATIGASGNTTFDVTFSPSFEGRHSATLTINNNDDDEAAYNFDISAIGNQYDIPTSQIAKILAGDPDSNDLFGRSVSISGDYAIVGAYGEDAGGSNAGAAYIYKRSGSSWTQEAKLLASDQQADDQFGYSVSISGDYAIVGAYQEDAGTSNVRNVGAAYIFKRSGSSWTQEAKLLASDQQADDFFGYSVSISGDYAIIGADQEDAGTSNVSNAGAAYIFKRSGTSWVEETKLLASDPQADDLFGVSVSISGDYAIVGAFLEDAGGAAAGAAYIYKRSGSSWTQEAKLLASDQQAGDQFGYSVSISGDYAIVGAYREDAGTSNVSDAGAAYIFKRSGTSWAEETKLLASDQQAFDWFGWSVSISGDYAIVGAYREDAGTSNVSNAGAAYIYKRSGSSWTQEAKLLASDPQATDFFGYSVSISGNYAIVGAIFEDAGGTDAGAAYFFGAAAPEINVQGGSPLVSIVDGDVTPDAADNTDFGTVAKGATQTVTYSIQNAGTDDLIISSIELAGAAPSNFVVSGITFPATIGASGNTTFTVTFSPSFEGRHSATLTINNNDDDEAAYNFDISAIGNQYDIPTSQIAKILAGDPGSNDQFGRSVSISGDYAIVGAHREDAGGGDAGAAYIYKRNGTSWTQEAKLLASDQQVADLFGYSVSISGDYAIIGAYQKDAGASNAGAAYIFKRSGTNWAEETKLLASDPQATDFFGYSVSISGDYAIVGAYNQDAGASDAGAAYIFKRSGTSWAEETKLLASDAEANDWFGRSVSISGDYAIVGAYREGAGGIDAGAAYIYKRSGSSWTQEAKLRASDPQAGDIFGYSVSISGDYAIVGAVFEDAGGSNAGAAYIFKRSGTSWVEETKLLASDADAGDQFGVSVSISGDYAIVGAVFEDAGGSNAGAAYIFKRSGTSWAEETKLLASDPQADDFFGISVSISGDYAIVGAFLEDTGDTDAGAAYMFGAAPEINVQGGSPLVSIVDGDVTPDAADNTDFGNVVSGANKVVTYTIQNTVAGSILTIADIVVSGTNAGDFVVSNFTTNTTVAGVGSTTFDVTFTPSALGVRNTIITITNNDADEAVYDFVVQGQGVIPTPISILPTPLSPANFTATSISTTQINLEWSSVAQNVTEYRIYRNNVLIATLPVGTTTYEAIGLDKDTRYSFSIMAVNSGNGEVKTSTPINASEATFPEIPTLLSISTICGEGKATLKIEGSGTIFRVYNQLTNGTLLLESNNADFELPTVSKTTTFYVSVIGIGGKESQRRAINVEVQPIFEAKIIGETIKESCETAIELEAQEIEGATYIWFRNGINLGITTKTLTATFSAEYQVRITKGVCSFISEKVNVQLNQNPVARIQQQSGIKFCQNGILNAVSAGQNSSYEWTFNNEVISQNQTLEVSQSGIYSLKVTTEKGCESSTSIEVIITETPQSPVLAITETVICPEGETTISIQNPQTDLMYEWTKNRTALQVTGNSITTSEVGIYRVRAISSQNSSCTAISNEVTFRKERVNPIYLRASEDKKSLFVEDVNFSQADIRSVEWYFNEVVAPNLGTTTQITPTEDGLYSAKITNQNGCLVQTRFVNFKVPEEEEVITGEEDLKQDVFKIYPNPSKTGLFNIHFGTVILEDIQISIFDGIGRKIYTTTFKKGNQDFTINLQNNTNGMYLIRFNQNGSTYSKQIIID